MIPFCCSESEGPSLPPNMSFPIIPKETEAGSRLDEGRIDNMGWSQKGVVKIPGYYPKGQLSLKPEDAELLPPQEVSLDRHFQRELQRWRQTVKMSYLKGEAGEETPPIRRQEICSRGSENGTIPTSG
ncbi:unnamed protein product [Nezara viridula]|uniref:Uncharacterized protein n=1 Tax=Nezara viridula TaxID=85310 RepID=A0A9P0HMJ0_NEZVI|nr:unnamed protein product [Nezara viridula]